MRLSRSALALIVLAVGPSALAACGGSSDSGSSPTPPADTGTVVRSAKVRDTAPVVPAADATQLASDNTSFAFDMYKGVASDETSNVFYSPYSVSLALAMTYAGAANGTATQMAGAMHFTLPAPQLHAAFDALDLALASRAAGDGTNPGFHLDVADALWGAKSLQFQSPFLDTLAVDYGAGLRVSDFEADPNAALAEINGWVSDQTQTKIANLLPDGSITKDTRFVLVNAIYFDAPWATQFAVSATAPGAFTKLDGSTVQANLMSQSAELSHTSDSGYEAVELPYAGGDTSMVVIVPEAGQFASIEASLTGDLVQKIFSSLSVAQVDLRLPKFTIHGQTISLATELKSLGMTNAFDPTSADFSAMLAPNQGQFWLSDVLHQAYVSVGETGTEAAAATAVIGVGASAVVESAKVDVTRPFFFVIRDRPTNTAIFVGRVMDPTL